MSETRVESSVTDGDLVRPMLALAWPVVVIQLLQVAYNVADTLWLGRLSADAVGAVSLAFPLVFLVISVGGGFTAAGAILVAQYTGAGGEQSAGEVAGQTITVASVAAVVLGVAGSLATDGMLAALPADPATTARVVPLAADYMRTFFLGAPFVFGFFVFVSLVRGHGDTRTPMRVTFVSVAVNVALDPLLIFGWGPVPALGVEGAAVATVASRALATAIGFHVLFRTRAGPSVRLHHLRPDPDHVRDVLRIGLPSAAEQSTSAVALVTLTAMVASFAPPVVAAAVLLAAGVVAALYPAPIVGVFLGDVPDAAATLAHAAEYLRIRAAEFAFIGVFQVLLGAFRGAGDTRTALAFSVLALWLGRVPIVYALAFLADLGPTGIWIGTTLGTVLGAVGAAAWFSRGTWKRGVVSPTPEPGPDTPEND